jgi:hypothetical protein
VECWVAGAAGLGRGHLLIAGVENVARYRRGDADNGARSPSSSYSDGGREAETSSGRGWETTDDGNGGRRRGGGGSGAKVAADDSGR